MAMQINHAAHSELASMSLDNQTDRPVIVAGGGPAGLMAAAEAALAGSPVILLEKMPEPGRKLLITGNGRCNVTNACEPSLLADHFFSGSRFLLGAFSRFSNRDMVALLQQSGIRLVEEPEGKLFPESGNAADILSFLYARARSAGVQIMTGHPVRSIVMEQGRVAAVVTDYQTVPAGAVILSTGGRSWPNTGSSGDGTRIAAALGHAVIDERPGLVPLLIPDPAFHALQGLVLRDIGLRLVIDGKVKARSRGDLLITHFGISGPVVLRLSRSIPDPFPHHPIAVSVEIDLAPDSSAEDVDRALLDLLAHEPRKLLRNSLPTAKPIVCPTAFSSHLMRLAGLDADLDGHSVTRKQRSQLQETIKACHLPVSGTRGWREAIVTAGGVDLTEINPKSMASRLVPGLFFAGEVMDIDADTGGFNLQAAWSTGYLAGRSAALHCLGGDNLL